MELKVRRARDLRGEMRPPSDKSMTHRAFMLASIADGRCVVSEALTGTDCLDTLHCLSEMGLEFHRASHDRFVLDPGPWRSPTKLLDCGNSGTSMRLLAGLIAGHNVEATLTGDESLKRRPMGRIAKPLRQMGATIVGETAPITIKGGGLQGIDYESPVASAQIKSCVLLAGLNASGETWVHEPAKSRDHTENMLSALGVNVLTGEKGVGVRGGSKVSRFSFSVPGDPSSAAFFMVAALLLNGELLLKEMSLNPTRIGILEALEEAGARLEINHASSDLGEGSGNVLVSAGSELSAFRIAGDLVPRLIDEIPILAVLATQADGVTEIRDAKELRVKESDRIESVAQGLRSMGAKVETFEDGMMIDGPTPLTGAVIDAEGDHRLAMSFAVAGLIADGKTEIRNADSIETSFPTFVSELERLVRY